MNSFSLLTEDSACIYIMDDFAFWVLLAKNTHPSSKFPVWRSIMQSPSEQDFFLQMYMPSRSEEHLEWNTACH